MLTLLNFEWSVPFILELLALTFIGGIGWTWGAWVGGKVLGVFERKGPP